MNSPSIVPADRQPGSGCWIVSRPGSMLRRPFERFVARRFADRFGARVSRFMPELHGFVDADANLRAVVGLCPAASAALFLERYLDRPVEQMLSAAVGREVERSRIVEVGNLAIAGPSGVRALLRPLTARLAEAGYDWVVFTGTELLRNAFHRNGLAPVHLTEADPLRLGAEREDWGSYYAHRPAVMAGRIAEGSAALLGEKHVPGRSGREGSHVLTA
jgi:hypothetical protein